MFGLIYGRLSLKKSHPHKLISSTPNHLRIQKKQLNTTIYRLNGMVEIYVEGFGKDELTRRLESAREDLTHWEDMKGRDLNAAGDNSTLIGLVQDAYHPEISLAKNQIEAYQTALNDLE
jgi:hypothetical protein